MLHISNVKCQCDGSHCSKYNGWCYINSSFSICLNKFSNDFTQYFRSENLYGEMDIGAFKWLNNVIIITWNLMCNDLILTGSILLHQFILHFLLCFSFDVKTECEHISIHLFNTVKFIFSTLCIQVIRCNVCALSL